MYLSAFETQYHLDDLFQDDNTSCTSSLATTVSMAEDMDDLYLGAEGEYSKIMFFFGSILIILNVSCLG